MLFALIKKLAVWKASMWCCLFLQWKDIVSRFWTLMRRRIVSETSLAHLVCRASHLKKKFYVYAFSHNLVRDCFARLCPGGTMRSAGNLGGRAGVEGQTSQLLPPVSPSVSICPPRFIFGLQANNVLSPEFWETQHFSHFNISKIGILIEFAKVSLWPFLLRIFIGMQSFSW